MSCHNPRAFVRSDDVMTMGHDRPSAHLWTVVHGGEYLEVACRQCEGCRARRARDWAIRGTHELASTLWDRVQRYKAFGKVHQRTLKGCPYPMGAFITLTYAPEFIGDGGLVHGDWSQFAARLRRELGPFRFLQCGEYGEHKGRKHFHACLFGVDFSADQYAWRRGEFGMNYRSPTLEKCWKFGHSEIAPLTFGTIKYTAGYVAKKLKRSEHEAKAPGKWREVDGKLTWVTRKQEYINVSRQPGLGRWWIERHWHRTYSSDEVHVAGKVYAPPLYYDSWLRDHYPSQYEEVLEKRIAAAKRHGVTSQKTLDARKAIHDSRARLRPVGALGR